MHGCYGRSNFSMLFFKADFLKTVIPRTLFKFVIKWFCKIVEKSLVLASGITYIKKKFLTEAVFFPDSNSTSDKREFVYRS